MSSMKKAMSIVLALAYRRSVRDGDGGGEIAG